MVAVPPDFGWVTAVTVTVSLSGSVSFERTVTTVGVLALVLTQSSTAVGGRFSEKSCPGEPALVCVTDRTSVGATSPSFQPAGWVSWTVYEPGAMFGKL